MLSGWGPSRAFGPNIRGISSIFLWFALCKYYFFHLTSVLMLFKLIQRNLTICLVRTFRRQARCNTFYAFFVWFFWQVPVARNSMHFPFRIPLEAGTFSPAGRYNKFYAFSVLDPVGGVFFFAGRSLQ